MADRVEVEESARKDKIAAAKKRLKQFRKVNGPHQTDGHVTPPKHRHSPQPEQNPTIESNCNSLNNSEHHETSDRSSHVVSHQEATHHSTMSESTERLHQLKRQITGLIAESSAYYNGEQANSSNGLEDLENRNRELASVLEQQSVINSQLTSQIDDLRQQNSRLQQTVESERKAFDEKHKRELGALKEQLQIHIQTIGILVSEKTELQSSLNQSQKLAESRHTEIEELSGRLKASRQRVAELERNFSTASNTSQKNEKSNKDLLKEVDKLKLDLYKINKSNEEFQQHNLELQGKLQKKLNEVAKLEDELIEVRGQLQMTELHVQQLQSGQEVPSDVSLKQIEELLAAKSELQTKLQLMEETVTKTQLERDATVQQYLQFIEQLQQQQKQLQTQVESLLEEKDQLGVQCREFESAISQLRARDVASTEMTVQNLEEKAELSERIEKLNAQLVAVSKNFEVQSADNAQLSRLIIEKEQRIMELEMALERASDAAVDKEKLLEIMQGDKTALSRAMAQNKELKNQLSELQNSFVKMSTDNMEMLTSLQSEQHVAKELAARLGQQEDELKEIREHLMQKEHELGMLHRRGAEHGAEHRHELSSEEMEQRMRDFSEQVPLIETLQRELSSAQDTINSLTVQNSHLKAELERQDSNVTGSTSSSAQVEALSTSVRQLEMERDGVLGQLHDSQALCQALHDKLENFQHDLAAQVPATLNGDVITRVQFEALQHAMKQLEEKYTRVMRDKADLTDKAERLEHIILQLQGETDTIGEYVTLYQQQRTAMRRRAEEREGYIYQLARDRIDMQAKLGELQSLVVQLLGERNMLHAYRLNTSTASNVCNGPIESSPKKHRHRAKANQSSDSSPGEEWPDYEAGSESGSESETEVVIAGGMPAETQPNLGSLIVDSSHTCSAQSTSHWEHESSLPDTSNIPLAASQTAQKIMHLLDEIGTSNLVERSSLDGTRFLHCAHCSGRLIVV